MMERRPLARSVSVARGLAGAIVAIGALILPAGIAHALDGDLGRYGPQANLGSWLDSLLPAHRDTSSFNHTAAEVEMSDRLWRFVASPDAPPWMAERPRTLRPGATAGGVDIGRYYTWLHGAEYSSSAVRYATVADDIAADLGTLPGAFAAVCAVERVDRQRVVAATGLPDAGADLAFGLEARQAENDRQIGEFVWALRYRYESYGFALDHLLVETPDAAARHVDAALAQLEPEVRAAEEGRFCGGQLDRPRRRAPPSLPSRFVHGNPPSASGDATPVGS